MFEEGGIPGRDTPFHGGFGMINLWGVPKPSMVNSDTFSICVLSVSLIRKASLFQRAFEMLNLLAETEAEATLSSNVSAATAGPGCDSCRDSDHRALLRNRSPRSPCWQAGRSTPQLAGSCG